MELISWITVQTSTHAPGAEDGWTALHVAQAATETEADKEDIEAAKFLLEQGAQVSRGRPLSPLSLA